MPDFQVAGNIDPFLLVALRKGEKIYSESDAMVTMEATLELKGEARGGFFSSIARKLTAGESLFQQAIEATGGDGQALLAPTLPGDIQILDIGKNQYRLNDGAFLACTPDVKISVVSQGIGKAILGGTGGFFIMETSGTGTLVISGFGAIFAIDVLPSVDTIVDNYHVVAWEKNLRYSVSLSTAKSGFFGNLVNSVTSGEGVVNRFSGNGKVYVCSRNRAGFVGWVASQHSHAGQR